MRHQDGNEQRHAGLEALQHTWQSMHREEEPGMAMKLTTDELCARVRFRERENVWFQWIVVVAGLGFGAFFFYRAVSVEQIWLRMASAWMAGLLLLLVWGGVRVGARTMRSGESCAQFMLRELDGSRQTAAATQWGFVLAMPSVLMAWWGGADGPWGPAVALLVLLGGAAGLRSEARKKSRLAEEWRRAIEGRA